MGLAIFSACFHSFTPKILENHLLNCILSVYSLRILHMYTVYIDHTHHQPLPQLLPDPPTSPLTPDYVLPFFLSLEHKQASKIIIKYDEIKNKAE